MSSRTGAVPDPKRQTRLRMAPEEREAEILAVARGLLREVGYEKFLPAEVARRCEVSEGLVYRYFPTKRDLLARVAQEWLAEVLVHEPDMDTCGSAAEGLRAVVDYAFEVIRAEPALTRYILLQLRAEADFRGSAVHLLNRRLTEHFTRVVEAAVAGGEYRDDVPLPVIRDMIFGAIEHQTWAYLRGEGDFPPRKVAAGIADVIHKGMLVRRAPKRRKA
ncbi:MAG TPA: TetR/AcrR family transcriptional regulator [Sporichthyaceae bacterium]|jgi:AcrR family transcriptional regulator|nr:TetR/AcrR family transcriptional regulator [Sporichthyaceae bacterium]